MIVTPDYRVEEGRYRVEEGRPVALVEIERVDGASTDVQVGELREAFASGEAGQRVLLSPFRLTPDSEPGLITIGRGPLIDGERALCEASAFAQSHPVHKSVVTQALLAPTTAECEQILAEIDPGWAEKRCDDSGCGCRMIAPDRAFGPELATVGILLAVLRARLSRAAAQSRKKR